MTEEELLTVWVVKIIAELDKKIEDIETVKSRKAGVITTLRQVKTAVKKLEVLINTEQEKVSLSEISSSNTTTIIEE